MSYLALARKWRPKQFSEVIGQEHVVSALSNALNNQRVHHAFLFTGTRGVGKTTLARIFAKALNCESGVSAEPCGECTACQGVDQGNFIDLIEVDAASRTKVDDTRELLDNVQYTPTQGRFKIYLIDEVHMLSTHSFNALLKTLEEPPAHVKFLLATTNPQKLPTTILSRCIQFNLKSVDIRQLTEHLEKILKAEEIAYELPALTTLSRSANGSVRDSLSLLDQAIAFSNGNIASDQVKSMLGMIDDHLIYSLLDRIIHNDAKGAFETIASMSEKSTDYATALDDLMMLIHNISLYQVSPDALEWKAIDNENVNALAQLADAEMLQLFYQMSVMGKRDFDFAPDPRSGFEMIILRMLAFQPQSATPQSTTGKKAITRAPKPVSESPPQTNPHSSNTISPTIGSPQETPDSAINHMDNIQPIRSVSATSSAIDQSSPDTSSIVEEPTQLNYQNNLSTPVTIKIEDLGSVEGWQNFINSSGMVGITREILMNMAPTSVEGKMINVTLDSASRHLFSDQRKRKIENHCKDRLSLDIQLNVEIEDLSASSLESETPTQILARKQREKETAAQQAFSEDNNVQNLINTFDANIVPESIKPGL